METFDVRRLAMETADVRRLPVETADGPVTLTADQVVVAVGSRADIPHRAPRSGPTPQPVVRGTIAESR